VCPASPCSLILSVGGHFGRRRVETSCQLTNPASRRYISYEGVL
jgi:hypothetical protein